MSRHQPHPVVDLRTSPYIRRAPPVDQIMRNVVYALLPICAFSVYLFGISALALMLVTTLSCLLSEQFFCRMAGKKSTLPDFSAVITGLLLALTLPPGFPLWMGAIAGIVGISLGKLLFGGIGCNVFNPALVGRAFVQAAFPVSISTWTPTFAAHRFSEFIPSTLALPFMTPAATAEWSRTVAIDGFTGATPLALMKFEGVMVRTSDLFFGTTAGSAGETPALLILICGAYLVARNMMDWRLPASVILGTAICAEFFYLLDPASYPTPLFMILSGGLMLGAVFMASDMVASPVTPWGIVLYGFIIGLLTVLIRLFGGLTEGVMYAILFANAASPLLETFTQPKVFGGDRK